MFIINNSEDLCTEAALSSLPEIPSNEITMLYYNGYYDGPLDGMCTFKEKNYYYQVVEESMWNGPIMNIGAWRYFLIALTPEQEEEEKRSQVLCENSNRSISDYKACKIYHDNKHQHPVTLKQEQLVGWFFDDNVIYRKEMYDRK